MLGYFEVRTDLALEAQEHLGNKKDSANGISVWEEHNEKSNIHTTTVVIETENSARVLGKPVGRYVTMEVPEMSSEDEDYHREISIALAEKIRSMRKISAWISITSISPSRTTVSRDLRSQRPWYVPEQWTLSS